MSGFPGSSNFDKRGQGTAVYPSGAVCVNTVYTSGGLSYWFYDDGARVNRRGKPLGGGRIVRKHDSSGIPCGPVICAFNPEGTGFANYTSGKPRLGELGLQHACLCWR